MDEAAVQLPRSMRRKVIVGSLEPYGGVDLEKGLSRLMSFFHESNIERAEKRLRRKKLGRELGIQAQRAARTFLVVRRRNTASTLAGDSKRKARCIVARTIPAVARQTTSNPIRPPDIQISISLGE